MKRSINFLGFPFIAVTREQAVITSLMAMGVFLLSSIWFGQSLLLYALALLITAIMILRFPAVGVITVLVLTMWFERHLTLQPLIIGIQQYKIYPIDFLLCVTVFSTYIAYVQKKISWQWTRLDSIIGVFALVVTIAFFLSFLTGGGSTDIIVSTYKNYVLYGVLYILASLLFTNRDEWQWAMKWFAIGGVGLFFFLFYGMLAGQGVWSEYTPLSTLGTRLIAGTHIFFMTLFSFWVLAMYIWESREDTHRPPFILLLLAIIAVGLIVSLVRHLWVALLLLCIVWGIFFVKEERDRFLYLLSRGIMAAAAIGLVAVWVYGLWYGEAPRQISRGLFVLAERIDVSHVIDLTDTSFGWRVAAWRAGIELWQTSPIVGVGLGEPVGGIHETVPFEIFVRDLHNNYLGVLIQLGLVGAVVVAYWFFFLLKKLYYLWYYRDRLTLFEKRLLFASASWIMLFMVIFSVSVYWDVNFFIIWWWFALAAFRWLYIQHAQ